MKDCTGKSCSNKKHKSQRIWGFHHRRCITSIDDQNPEKSRYAKIKHEYTILNGCAESKPDRILCWKSLHELRSLSLNPNTAQFCLQTRRREQTTYKPDPERSATLTCWNHLSYHEKTINIFIPHLNKQWRTVVLFFFFKSLSCIMISFHIERLSLFPPRFTE